MTYSNFQKYSEQPRNESLAVARTESDLLEEQVAEARADLDRLGVRVTLTGMFFLADDQVVLELSSVRY